MPFLSFLKTLADIAKGASTLDKPDLHINSFIDIDIDKLRRNEIAKIIIDLDQTMVFQSSSFVPKDYLNKLQALSREYGTENICFLTNGYDSEREANIETSTGIKVLSGKFRKPHEKAYMAALDYLGAQQNKTTAMIGDRVWTDIVGANRLGLFTIQVKPLSPQDEKIGTSLIRKGEIFSQRSGIKTFVSLFLAFLTLAGMGIIQFIYFIKSLAQNAGRIGEFAQIINVVYPLFFVSILYFYFKITVENAKFGRAELRNKFLYYFNTYPLFFRFILSSVLLLISTSFWVIAKFSIFDTNVNLPPNLFQIAIFYNFVVLVGLIVSLTGFYHSDIGRVFRIFFDIIVVIIISASLPENWTIFSAMLFLIPVGTAARYYGWEVTALVVLVCSVLLFPLLREPYTIPSVFTIFFIMVAVTLKIEYRETVFPIDTFLLEMENKDFSKYNECELLKIFSKNMHCQAVYYIKNRTDGFYYMYDNGESSGQIHNFSNEEIFNYISTHDEFLLSESHDFRNNEIYSRQKGLMRDLPQILRPFLPSGIISVMAAKVPHKRTEYLIFTNNLTRNGIARRIFSLRQARMMVFFANVLSLRFASYEKI